MAFGEKVTGFGVLKTLELGNYTDKKGVLRNTKDFQFLYDADGVLVVFSGRSDQLSYTPGKIGVPLSDIKPELIGQSFGFIADVSDFGKTITRLVRLTVPKAAL
jgi:hypothetical protein